MNEFNGKVIFAIFTFLGSLARAFQLNIGNAMLKRLKEYPLDNVPVNMEKLLENPVFRDLF